jgi:hypothetical protein
MAKTGGFFTRIESFTVIACLFLVLQAMYSSGFIPATLSTFEREFGLTSLQASTIVTSYTMAKLFLGVPLTYFGGKQHVPRFLGITCLVCGCSAILTSIPYFIKTAEKKTSIGGVCFKNGHPESALCSGSTDFESSGLEWFVIIAQVLNGIGATTLYTLIPAYINGNAEATKATRHVGYYLSCGPLGVAIGFVVGGNAVGSGHWGVPFLVSGILMIALVPFFFLLPKVYEVEEEVVGTVDPEPVRKRSSSQFSVPVEHTQETNIQDFVDGAKVVGKNPVWWLLSLAATAEAFFVVGISNYGPKYIESQYSISAGAASQIAGAILVPGAIVGQIGGALVDSKSSKNMKQSSILTWRIALAAFFITCTLGMISCETNQVEVINAKCGNMCNCANMYEPVCVGGDKLYFNGCYLGCTDLDATTGMFSNCSACGSINGALPPNTEIKQGHCESMKCNTILSFLIVMFMVVSFTFANNPPANMLQMRIVPPQYSAIALSLSDIIYRLLGNFPGVTVFSSIFDASCISYNEDICGQKLSCSYYDNTKLRQYFAILGAIPKLLSFLMFFAAAWTLLKYKLPEALAPYKQDANDESELGLSLNAISSSRESNNNGDFESNDV